MPFDPTERDALLALKGVGPTVLQRLEQMGLDSFAQLREATAEEILRHGATLTGSNCWKNSTQARAAIDAILHLAGQG